MADHEPNIRQRLIEWEARCICAPKTSLGSFLFHESAVAAFEAHKTEVGVKPPVEHNILLHEDVLGSGVTCGCTCAGWTGGHFSKVESAVLAWRKHSNK
jgi:hypothetical protein